VSLLDRHIEFVEALRAAGLPVSLAEGLEAVRAIDALDIDRRDTLRAAYAATLVKRQNHRPGFDQVFDLYFPLLVGDGHDPSVVEEGQEGADDSGFEPFETLASLAPQEPTLASLAPQPPDHGFTLAMIESAYFSRFSIFVSSGSVSGPLM
jgi:uncharacterized protein with von Willebrand factor type A (vWA) domain